MWTGMTARVRGPAFARVAADGANLDHAIAHLQVGGAFQAHLGSMAVNKPANVRFW